MLDLHLNYDSLINGVKRTMRKISKILHKLWKFITIYKYAVVIISCAFLFVVNGLLERCSNEKIIAEYQKEIKEYKQMHRRDSAMIQEFETNPEVVRKIVREKYFMHKANEDIFVFSDEITTDDKSIDK